MTQEEKTERSAVIIKELKGIEPFKPVMNMTVVELYNLIKLAVNRKQQDY